MDDSLSPWLAADRACRLHAWSGGQMRSALAAFEQACGSWASDWGMTLDAARVEPLVRDLTGTGWIEGVDARGTACIWMRQWPAGRCMHECAAFGAGATPVTEELVRMGRMDFERRMLGAFAATATSAVRESLPVQLAAEWSGALQFVAGDLLVVADGPVVRRLLGIARGESGVVPAAGRLCRVDEALGDIALAFDLELAPCELDASLLLSLAPGDVACLPHALDAPVRVRDGEGRDCFQGDLRRHGGMRAVQLRAASPGNPVGRAV